VFYALIEEATNSNQTLLRRTNNLNAIFVKRNIKPEKSKENFPKYPDCTARMDWKCGCQVQNANVRDENQDKILKSLG
jgi:hypothetical protein